MKVCKRCGIAKPPEAFNLVATGQPYRRGTCKECDHGTLRQWRAEHPDREAERVQRWLEQHPGMLLMYKRRHHLKRFYGMTFEEFEARLASQDGVCAICQRAMDPICVDHDHACCPGLHSCGRCVRGLLCQSCNRGLGAFGDHLERVERAVAYLRTWKDD